MSPRLAGPLVLAAGVAVATAAPLHAQTADQVVARYVEARGGLEKIRAVETLRFTGRMTLPDVEAPLVVELKRPNRMRTEFVFKGKKGVRAFDGKNAWIVLPIPGMEEPQAMSPEDAAEAREQSDLDLSPLVDAAAKGFTVELVGREPGLGKQKESIKLLVRSREGVARTLFVDPRTWLVTRIEETRTIDGEKMEFETLVGDYRTVAGVVLPHLLEVGPKRGEGRQKLIFDRIEVNAPIDDARFKAPAR
jgi:outer membrane lipoprotein-sorting protein